MIFPDKVCVILSAAIHLLHASIAHPGNTCYIMSLKIGHPNYLFRAPAGGLGTWVLPGGVVREASPSKTDYRGWFG